MRKNISLTREQAHILLVAADCGVEWVDECCTSNEKAALRRAFATLARAFSLHDRFPNIVLKETKA